MAFGWTGGRIVSSDEFVNETNANVAGQNQLSGDAPAATAMVYQMPPPPPYRPPEHQPRMINVPDEDGDLPIHIATAKENYAEVLHVLKMMRSQNMPVEIFNNMRQTPLHIAVVTNNLPIIGLLLEFRMSPRFPDRHGNTAIHLAVKCKECSRVTLDTLLSHPDAEIVVNNQNYDGFTPMHLAVFRQDLEIIKVLVCRNADVDATDGTGGRSPLFHAVENGFQHVVELLVQLGANVNLPNFGGVTPLVVATDRGNQTVTSMLISKGAMMSCRDDFS